MALMSLWRLSNNIVLFCFFIDSFLSDTAKCSKFILMIYALVLQSGISPKKLRFFLLENGSINQVCSAMSANWCWGDNTSLSCQSKGIYVYIQIYICVYKYMYFKTYFYIYFYMYLSLSILSKPWAHTDVFNSNLLPTIWPYGSWLTSLLLICVHPLWEWETWLSQFFIHLLLLYVYRNISALSLYPHGKYLYQLQYSAQAQFLFPLVYFLHLQSYGSQHFLPLLFSGFPTFSI